MVAKHQFVLPCRILCYASVCHKKEDVHITFTCQVIKRTKEELLQKKNGGKNDNYFRTINMSLLCSVTSGRENCNIPSPLSWRSCRSQPREVVCQQVTLASFVCDPETEGLQVKIPLCDPYITILHYVDPGKSSVAKLSFSIDE